MIKNGMTSTPSALNIRITRRTALASIAAASAIPLTANLIQAQSADGTPTPTAGESIGDAVTPNWRFTVLDFQDPYTGKLSKPEGVPNGTRVVSSQIILTNDSDQPLQFTITDIRLHDSEGFEYRAGAILGTEPRIVSQNLPDGERSRGWVWFAIPTGNKPVSLLFEAPPPILSVNLP